MSSSRSHGRPSLKKWFRPFFKDETLRIVDIGCGKGNYRALLKRRRRDHWTGVEAWEPYVEQFDLLNDYYFTSRRGRRHHRPPYDRVLIRDARQFMFGEPYDVCVMGDVLEHLERDAAVALVWRAKRWCRYVVCCIPFGDEPQEAVGGNPWMRHVYAWTYQGVLATWPDLLRLDQPKASEIASGQMGPKIMFVLEGLGCPQNV